MHLMLFALIFIYGDNNDDDVVKTILMIKAPNCSGVS